jgi:predicted aspartyl protease
MPLPDARLNQSAQASGAARQRYEAEKSAGCTALERSVTTSDITGKQTYVLADGSKAQSPTFIIRSLKVGDRVVANVRASVASSTGSLLLGQSFLERFKSWSIDNTKHELRLEPH